MHMGSSLPGLWGAQDASAGDSPELGTSSADAAQPLRAAPPGAGGARPDAAAAGTSWTALSLLLLRPTDPCGSPTPGAHGVLSAADTRAFGAGATMRPASELPTSGAAGPGRSAAFAAASLGSRAARGWRTSGCTACACTSAQQAPSPQAVSHVSQTMWMPHQRFANLRRATRRLRFLVQSCKGSGLAGERVRRYCAPLLVRLARAAALDYQVRALLGELGRVAAAQALHQLLRGPLVLCSAPGGGHHCATKRAGHKTRGSSLCRTVPRKLSTACSHTLARPCSSARAPQTRLHSRAGLLSRTHTLWQQRWRLVETWRAFRSLARCLQTGTRIMQPATIQSTTAKGKGRPGPETCGDI